MLYIQKTLTHEQCRVMVVSLHVHSASDSPGRKSKKWLKIYGNQTGGCTGEGGQIGKTSKKKSQLKTSHKPLIY